MKLRTLLLACSSASLLLMLASTTFAQTTPDASTVTSSGIDTDLQNLIAGYGTSMQTAPTTPAPGSTVPDTAYLFPHNGTPQIQTTENIAAGQATIMTGVNIGPYQTAADGVTPATQATASNVLSITDPVSKTGLLITTANAECTSSLSSSATVVGNLKCIPNVIPPNLQTLDMSSFINPLAYSDNGVAAQSFVNYVTGQYVPNVLYSTTPQFQTQLAAAGTYGQALEYLFAARTIAAGVTVGLANLQHLYQERIPVSGLGTTAGIPSVTNASPLQVDDYSARRRAVNSTWYTSMETAGPAVVQRETLYVLAELRMEMFKTRMELERLVAIASITVSEQAAVTSQSVIAPLQNQLNPVNTSTLATGKPAIPST